MQFIIATHSPLIMVSSESVFDLETDKLFQIKLSAETSDAVVTEENFIKYGQVNAWLTSPIFNLNQARATEAEHAINEAKALQLDDDPSDADVQVAHQKLLQSLAQNDPFWPRWIYFAEQHGGIMIHIDLKPEPADFDARVRQPGNAFLSSTPTPNSKQWSKNNYWSRCSTQHFIADFRKKIPSKGRVISSPIKGVSLKATPEKNASRT